MSGIIVSHDALVGGDHNVSELSTWQDIVGPFFEIGEGQVIPGGNDSAFVDSTDELDDNFLRAMVINDLELTDVAMLLHEPEKLNNHF